LLCVAWLIMDGAYSLSVVATLSYYKNFNTTK
jgi:hypothetical protein